MYRNHVINKPKRVIAALIPLALVASLGLGTLANAAPEDDAAVIAVDEDLLIMPLADEVDGVGDLGIMPADDLVCDPKDPDDVSLVRITTNDAAINKWYQSPDYYRADAGFFFVNHDVEISMSLDNEAYILFYHEQNDPDPLPYTGPITVSEEGIFLFFGIPMCGDEANTYRIDSIPISIDKTLPEVSGEFKGGKLVLSAWDLRPASKGPLSGVAAIYYTTDSETAKSIESGDYSKWTLYRGPITPTEPGLYTFVSVDNAGNISKPQSILLTGPFVPGGGSSNPSLSVLFLGLSLGLITMGSMGLWYRRLSRR